MKKTFKKILSIFLAVSCTACVAACKEDEETKTPQGGSDVVIEESGIDLVKNGTSQYRIVVPDNSSDLVDYAANELVLNFKNSTGITLPVVTSAQAGSDLTKYNLALGDTALATAANVSCEGMKETGFKLVLKDNTLVMKGGADHGTLYAAYEFLERNLGYQYYAEEEIYIDSVYNAKMLDFNYAYEPTIEYSQMSVRSVNTGNGVYRYKSQSTPAVLGWPHSYNYFLPPSTYPQYYKMGNTTVLCLSDQAMWEDFAKNVIKKFDEDPTLRFCMLGSEDAWGQCTCHDCQAEYEKYTYTGNYILFGNYVARRVKEHFAEIDPTREANIMLLAYFNSFNAPVKTGANGETVLYHEDLKGEDNLYVQVCLVSQDFASSIYSTANLGMYNELKNWKLVTDNLWTYIYDGFEVNYNMYYYFDWEYKTDTLKALAELGYEQVQWEIAPSSTKIVAFEKLRSYHSAKLLYDPSLDSNKLVDDFMTHYYKEAAPYLREYFDMLNINFKLFQKKMAAENKHVGMYIQLSMNKYLLSTDLWTELLLDKSLDLFDKALEAIKNSDAYDDTQREIMLLRVEQERLVPRRYKLQLYKNSYTTAEYAKLVDELNEDIASFGGTVRLDK